MPTIEPAAPGVVPGKARIEVEVVHAWPDRCWSRRLVLPDGACVGQALDAVADEARAAGVDPAGLGLAVFGRLAGRDTPLRDGDRIEWLRPLVMDPKQARAARAATARKRAAAQARGR